jgi:hypothetical protein
MDPHELAERERLAKEEADRVKRDLPRIRLEAGSDGDAASPTESAGELGEEGQFGVETDET